MRRSREQGQLESYKFNRINNNQLQPELMSIHQTKVCSVNEPLSNPDDSALEYCIEAQSPVNRTTSTWELRSKLFPHAFAAVLDTDLRESETTQRELAEWTRKRCRNYEHQGDILRSQLGVLVSSGAANGKRSDADDGDDEAFLVGLGEWSLQESSSQYLNSAKKKKCHRQLRCKDSYESALLLERQWSERHAVSLKHSCMKGAHPTPAAQNFELGCAKDLCRDASSVEIHSITPAASVVAAEKTRSVTACEPPTEQERKKNRGVASEHEGTQNFAEHLVVQYFIPDGSEAESGKSSNDTRGGACGRGLYSMPLSVFRYHYPQLLLDFLLQHSVVMESS